mgnify:FL=1
MRQFCILYLLFLLTACTHLNFNQPTSEQEATTQAIHQKEGSNSQIKENTSAKNLTLSSAQESKQFENSEEAYLNNSDTQKPQTDLNNLGITEPTTPEASFETDVSHPTSTAAFNPSKGAIDTQFSNTGSELPFIPLFSIPQHEFSSTKLPQKRSDTTFNLNALLPRPKSSSDFSEYGFITPTDDLERLVNHELKLLRESDVKEQADSDLVERLRSHFKLDLQLDKKRIRSQLNWYVRNPSYLDRTFKRSARYLHYVVEEVKKRDLPMELALLPFVESAYDPFAYSHGRASGLWQFIPGTGKIYGLHQNWWYDGRRDVLASTKAALDYLTYLNKRFNGNWLHALASYNSGSGRVSKAIRKNKKRNKPTDFWSLKLPRETQAYVPKLLALAKIVQNPEAYGVSLPSIPDTPYFAVVKTKAQIDLAQAASLAQVDINEIYKLNPGFNQWASAPLGPHRLLVPSDKAASFSEALKLLPPEKRLNWNRYTIRRGDSLIRIAKKFNTTPKLIKQVNHLSSNKIKAKQKLLIPIASKGKSYYDLSQVNRLESKQKKLRGSTGSQKITYKVKSGDTIWDLARAHKVGVRSLAKWNGIAPTDPIKPGQKLLIWSKKNIQETAKSAAPLIQKREMIKRIGYRVRKGDSLAKIANKFNVSIKNLLVWNKLNRKKYIQPGQKLTIFVDITNS